MPTVRVLGAAVINLHKHSVKTHFEVFSGLTGDVRSDYNPFGEHYQTPAILEILCADYRKFANSMETFSDLIKKNENIVGREAARCYAGFYGSSCVVDFALIPGYTSSVVNQILLNTDIPGDHRRKVMGYV